MSKQRIKRIYEEYSDLKIKLGKLDTFKASGLFLALDGLQQDYLIMQGDIMRSYLSILRVRTEYEVKKYEERKQ